MAKKKKDSYITPQQKELRDLIELKKMRQAAAENREVDVSELFQQEEKIVPKTFKEKWKNYWYHYKTATWVTVIAVILGAWFIKDIFFGPKYDVAVAVATKYAFSAYNQSIAQDMAEYVEDYNGDKKVNVMYDEMTLDYSLDATVDPQVNMTNMQKFMAVMSAGEELVYILDQDTYDAVVDNAGVDIFVSLEALYPEQTETVKGDKLILNGTRLGKRMGAHNAEEDIFLCIRALVGTADGSKEHIYNAYRNGLAFIHNIMVEEYPVLRGTEVPMPE